MEADSTSVMVEWGESSWMGPKAVTAGCFNAGKLSSSNVRSCSDCVTAIDPFGIICDAAELYSAAGGTLA